MISAREYQDVAARVSRTLGAAEASTLDAALDVSLEELGRLSDADVAYLTLLDEDECICDDWHWVRPGRTATAPEVGTPFRQTFGSIIEILRVGATIAVDDLDEIELAPSERALASANELRGIIAVPVRVGDVLLGVAGVQAQQQPRHWEPATVAHVELLAQLLVQAVVRTQERGALAAADLRARRIAEHLPDGLVFLDLGWRLQWTSPSFLRTWGRQGTDPIGRHLADLVHPDDRGRLPSSIGEPGSATLRVETNDGWRWTDLSWQLASDPGSGVDDEVVVSLRDVHERQVATEELSAAVTRDPLTGVANRAGLEQALHRLAAEGREVLLAYLDVDRFKEVNDTFGHDVGDEVLRAIGAALTDAMRSVDVVARVGGDEFVVVVTDAERSDVAVVGPRRLAAVAGVSTAAGAVSASIGLSDVGSAGEGETLRQAADRAMYEAKRSGRGTWRSTRGEP